MTEFLRISTADVSPNNKVEFWRSAILKYHCRQEIILDSKEAPECSLIGKFLGNIAYMDSKSSAFFSSIRTQRDIRADGLSDLTIGFLRRGALYFEQDERRVVRRPGTFQICDLSRPYRTQLGSDHHISGFSIPRETIEKNFGSAKIVTSLRIDESHGSKTILDFFASLFDNMEIMSPESVQEMSAVGIELILSALSRRLAIESPIPQSAALLLFRAKTYAISHISSRHLSPPEIAAALGISLRHLQGLFQREGTSPSEWIWSTRTALAKDRLVSPSHVRLSISEIAFGCGFQELSHFSKKFKSVYGCSPREWRAENSEKII